MRAMRYKRVNYKEYAEKTTFEQELKRTCSDDSCIVCPQPEPIDDPCCQPVSFNSINIHVVSGLYDTSLNSLYLYSKNSGTHFIRPHEVYNQYFKIYLGSYGGYPTNNVDAPYINLNDYDIEVIRDLDAEQYGYITLINNSEEITKAMFETILNGFSPFPNSNLIYIDLKEFLLAGNITSFTDMMENDGEYVLICAFKPVGTSFVALYFEIDIAKYVEIGQTDYSYKISINLSRNL